MILHNRTATETPEPNVPLPLQGNFAEGYVDGDLVAAVPVSATTAHPALVVRIEEPSSESRARFYRSLALLAAAGLAIVALAAAVGAWLAHRLNRPIVQLTDWASSTRRDDVPPPEPTGVDEIDSLRTALVDDRARIEELLERERSFSSQVSHQLRTPVAAMRVAVETELAAPRPDASTVLHESLGQLERLESTISSLLALARNHPRELVECDLLALARRTADHWTTAVEQAGRRLTVSGDPVSARVDRDAVGHVLDVLLDNALRHGAGAITIDVHGSAADATIDVVDQGPSPGGDDPFAEAGSDSSHGIGLRLARSLAEATGGRLALLDAPTTTFRLTLTL
jgi:signal transduction histidine kinase